VAWANAGLHALALVLALAWVRPASLLVPLDRRLAQLARDPLGFQLGWATWALCALAFVATLAALGRAAAPGSHLAALAVSIAAASAAVDLTADALYIAVLPPLAAASAPPADLFRAVEGIAWSAGVLVANSLYSLAVLAMTLALLPRREVRARVHALGVGSFLCGMAVTAGGLAGSPFLVAAATGPTIVLFALWALGAARSLARGASASGP
jgi:hypothetical protein